MTIDEAIAEATRAATTQKFGSNFRFRITLDREGFKLVPAAWRGPLGPDERQAPPPWPYDVAYAWQVPCLIERKS